MNIFFLHANPKKCARYHLDRHVVKMILETCQLLCTAIWLCGEEAPYKKTHENHPSAKWARANNQNWEWLKSLGEELCKEYTFRYNKKHACEDVLKSLRTPKKIPKGVFFPPTPAMPQEYKTSSELISYRKYYAYGKKHLHFFKNRHAWKKRRIPKFILNVYEKDETMRPFFKNFEK